METKAYACINTDNLVRLNSSSGGIYPLLALKYIEHGGIVFAAVYDDELNVVHRMINNPEGISLSQGSKYVASVLGDSFKSILQLLSTGKKVLFVGTPCQCAGLNSFLEQNHIDRDCIILIDFVCHGIPSRMVWNEYKKSLRRRNKSFIAVNMRDKTSGWSKGNYSWKFSLENGGSSVVPRRDVSFMKGMLTNLYLRPSCYDCHFKGIGRCTDLTLGDYWGVWNHMPEMDDDKGTSLVLIHSERGLRLFDEIRNNTIYQAANLIEAIKANSCIVVSAKCNPSREEFFRRIGSGEDFSTIVQELTSLKIKKKIINRVKAIIKRIIRK